MTPPPARDPLMMQVLASIDYPSYLIEEFLSSNGPEQAWAKVSGKNPQGTVTAAALESAVLDVLAETLDAGAEPGSLATDLAPPTSPVVPREGFFPPAGGAFPAPRDVTSMGEGLLPQAVATVDFDAARLTRAILRSESILKGHRQGRLTAAEAVERLRQEVACTMDADPAPEN